MRLFIVYSLTALIATTGFSTIIEQIGSYNNWATDWTSLGGYDADDGETDYLDFVGNASNPGLYYANNGDYISFRMRVDADTFTTAAGAHLLLIDVDNYGVTGIDYGFSWDSKSNQEHSHGLEMSITAKNGPTWGVSQLDDMDGADGSKGTIDINGEIGETGEYRSTDGYVRSTDEQAGGIFGDTTFIDFAVSWAYLETYTNLRQDQTWSIGLASIANATDHNAFNADVSGANLEDSIFVGWSTPVAVPEPASILMIGFGGALTLLIRRLFCS